MPCQQLLLDLLIDLLIFKDLDNKGTVLFDFGPLWGWGVQNLGKHAYIILERSLSWRTCNSSLHVIAILVSQNCNAGAQP